MLHHSAPSNRHQAPPTTHILSTGNWSVEAAESGGRGDTRVKANVGGVAESGWHGHIDADTIRVLPTLGHPQSQAQSGLGYNPQKQAVMLLPSIFPAGPVVIIHNMHNQHIPQSTLHNLPNPPTLPSPPPHSHKEQYSTAILHVSFTRTITCLRTLDL